MKTRACEWLDTSTMDIKYGIQVFDKDRGKWTHAATSLGPIYFDTSEARDLERKRIRGLKDVVKLPGKGK